MTSPPSPPNGRRRRIVIAVVVLLLVSLVSWWYWPRGDARFVGRWATTWSQSAVRIHGTGGALEFSRNGTGRHLTRSRNKSVWFSWTVRGDVLETGRDPPELAKSWALPFAQRVYDWTWHTIGPAKESYQILGISENEIRLTLEGELLILTRIPE